MITLDESISRGLMLRLTYQLNKDRLGDFDTFSELMKDYRFIAIIKDYLPVGTVAVSKDNYAHICIRKEYRKQWAGKWLVKLISDLSKEQDLYTTVFANDSERYSFALRLGFRKYQIHNNVITLVKEKGER